MSHECVIIEYEECERCRIAIDDGCEPPICHRCARELVVDLRVLLKHAEAERDEERAKRAHEVATLRAKLDEQRNEERAKLEALEKEYAVEIAAASDLVKCAICHSMPTQHCRAHFVRDLDAEKRRADGLKSDMVRFRETERNFYNELDLARKAVLLVISERVAALAAVTVKDAEIERLKSEAVTLPHASPDVCPTYYDGCHCDTFVRFEEHKKVLAEIAALRAKLDEEPASEPIRKEPPMKSDDFPRRRNRVDKTVPAELAIRAAIQAVEEMGADTKLTAAVIFLGKAQEQVANFVDDRETIQSAIDTYAKPADEKDR